MEKRNSQLEHGQPMEQTRGLLCTCESGVARCQSQHQRRVQQCERSRALVVLVLIFIRKV